jgi:hypothetical protein
MSQNFDDLQALVEELSKYITAVDDQIEATLEPY